MLKLLRNIFRIHSPSKCSLCEPHKEQFTKCDLCEYLSICQGSGSVIPCTTLHDDFEHYTLNFGCECRREEFDKLANEHAEIHNVKATINDILDTMGVDDGLDYILGGE